MKNVFISGLLLALTLALSGQLKPGDTAPDFTLKNVDGKEVSLADYSSEKGVILVFTCNPCPFAKAYEQRIIDAHKKFAPQGFPVVAINPNSDKVSPDDTYEKMQEKAKEKDYPFPYLKDVSQDVYKSYGATRTPHIYLLEKKGNKFKLVYVGAIDDNAMEASAVKEKYLEQAISAVMAGEKPDPSSTKAIGCTIKS